MPFPIRTRSNIERLHPPETVNGVRLEGIQQGDWIEIETGSSTARRQRINARAMTNVYVPADNAFRLQIDPFLFKTATLEEAIVGWSNPEPWEPSYIGGWQPELTDWLYNEYLRASAPLSEDEKNASRGSSTHGRPEQGSPVTSGIS